MFVLIIGGGKVGSYLARMLLDDGWRVCIIENRAERVDALLKELPSEVVVLGNGTDPVLLEKSGILKANVIAAVTGADETNLVVTNLARLEFGVSRTIARINNPKNAWMFTKQMGVDVALNQADLMAHLIREEMSLGDMMTLLKLRQGAYSLVEEMVDPTSAAVGKKLSELELPGECVITAIIRGDRLIIPRGGSVFQAGDEVLAVVHADSQSRLAALLGSARP